METLEHLARTPTVLLSTRRRDGRIVHTPMNLAVDDRGFGYFRTWPDSGKVKRLANFPGVRVCRCTRNGHPQSSDQPALASRLAGAEAEHARQTLNAKYRSHRWLAPAVDRLRRRQPVYYRLEPADEPTPWTGPHTAASIDARTGQPAGHTAPETGPASDRKAGPAPAEG